MWSGKRDPGALFLQPPGSLRLSDNAVKILAGALVLFKLLKLYYNRNELIVKMWDFSEREAELFRREAEAWCV